MIKEKSKNLNSTISTETAISKSEVPVDIFQELREKKRKEPKSPPGFSRDEPPMAQTPNSYSRLVVAALLGAILGFACTFFLTGAKATPSEHRGAREELPFNISRSLPHHAAVEIETLKSKHNAVEWADSIRSSRRGNPFSIELEDALIRPDARPVLVRCTLLDIAYGNLGIVTKFGIPGSSENVKNMLILETRKEQLKIFATASRGVTQYAVVAKCTSAQGAENGGRVILGRLIDIVELEEK